ncbi:hypothetical protein LNP74_22055 [Klebsiella pneumoniae subsp. pneumoniae]|nr:hypothetical protein [Klebsiella pneumoniae subsp. pneumoniae]
MHDPSAPRDTPFGTLIDHTIVGTTHQHIYSFRLTTSMWTARQLPTWWRWTRK